MGYFQGGNRSRGRDGGRPQMHDAVCDECGNDCQVPFRPSGEKPIYCSNCFEQKGGGRDDRSRGGRGSSRGGFGGGRPQRDMGDGGTSKLVESLEKVNNKLDTIIGLLSEGGKKKPKVVKAKAKLKKK